MTHEQLLELANELRTQDNLYTAHVCFEVQECRKLHGMDDHYISDYVWTSGGEEITNAEEIAELESAFDAGDDAAIGDCERVAYVDQWWHVHTFLTGKAAREYIVNNGHRHKGELRVFGESFHRNPQMIALREWLLAYGKDTNA